VANGGIGFEDHGQRCHDRVEHLSIDQLEQIPAALLRR
jgi:hypothetical protein